MKIAIDGPAGAGKSTVAKIVATKLNLLYIDTGAMYRAITYAALKYNVNCDSEDDIKNLIKRIEFQIKKNTDTNEMDIFIDNERVNDFLRTQIIDNNVSKISSYKCVRDFMVKIQREIAEKYNVILDGRDIGTVVLPDADFKFFLDASVDERAKRRFYDEKNKEKISIEKIKEDLIKRDKLDSSREIAPLKKAEDAIYIDTTNKSIDEVVNIIISKIKNKI